MKAPVELRLSEWSEVHPDTCEKIRGLVLPPELKPVLDELARTNRLTIVELARGVQITTTSWIGRLELGALTLTIAPKIDGTPLATLLRYAYGLRDLELQAAALHSAAVGGLQDLLVLQLVTEARELIARGLHRDYERRFEDLGLPRGRIAFSRMPDTFSRARAVLPCVHHPRTLAHALNVALSGALVLGARVAGDSGLRANAWRLVQILSEEVPRVELTIGRLEAAERKMDRRHGPARPAGGKHGVFPGAHHEGRTDHQARHASHRAGDARRRRALATIRRADAGEGCLRGGVLLPGRARGNRPYPHAGVRRAHTRGPRFRHPRVCGGESGAGGVRWGACTQPDPAIHRPPAPRFIAVKEIAPGVGWTYTSFVNVYFIGEPGGPWALVDTGLPFFTPKIRAAAAARYGHDARPEAIFLTHGHFDHAGSALALADAWDVPVYAHRLELPYLNGRSDYPPPDPTVGGGIAMLSRVMPHGGRNLGQRLRVFSPDAGESDDGMPGGDHGTLPGFGDWRWLHTPGHSPGHVAFYRESDRTLLAGDAIATMNMDSYLELVIKQQELAAAGSPFISDWEAYGRSVEHLAALEPAALGCGHGTPMTGPEVAGDLHRFCANFTPPSHGRYVAEPARADERGVDWLPPAPTDSFPYLVGAAALGLILALSLSSKKRE